MGLFAPFNCDGFFAGKRTVIVKRQGGITTSEAVHNMNGIIRVDCAALQSTKGAYSIAVDDIKMVG